MAAPSLPLRGESAILGHMAHRTPGNLTLEFADNPLYLHLYQLAREEPLGPVLDIGAGSGGRSTRILIAALAARRDEMAHQPGPIAPELYCLEPDPAAFASLQGLAGQYPWIHPLRAYSAEPARFPSPEQVLAYYRQPGNALRRYSENEVLEWLAYEQLMYERRGQPGALGGIDALRRRYGLAGFDLVLLDGSEFTTGQDLDAVYGARVLVLAGANTFKNAANYHRLMQDAAYVLIQQNLEWQHGFAVFKRRAAYAPGLTAIVHARNAAAMLPEALASLSFADQRIVIEMDSSDDTVAVARAHGAEVAYHLPVSCVDEARNWGLSLARHAWTLVLDADERIPEALARQIQALIRSPEALDGYWLARRNFFFGHEVPHLFPDYQLRLFRSQQAYWRGVVHELPLLRGSSTRLPENADLAIQHYSYRDLNDFVQRQLRYADTLWQQKGRFPIQTMPSLAHELRARYEAHQRQLLDELQLHTPEHLEWLVKQLYLFSDLALTGTLLQNSGQLGSGGARPAGMLLSAYSYIKNAEKFDYPMRESLLSVMEVCDEVVVGYAVDSDDRTLPILQDFAERHPKLRLFPSEVWKTPRTGGETIRLAAEEAMAACRGEWRWHVQADEVYTREDAREVRRLVEMYLHQSVHGFRFQVLHFYGDYDTLIAPAAQEIGWYQHTIRLARAGQGRHFGDAWTMTLASDLPTAVVNTPIRIFHYGHVREHEAMRRKSSYMEQLYHQLPENFEVCKPGEYSYDRVPSQYLLPNDKIHPQGMLQRIARWRLRRMEAARVDRKPRVLVISRFHKVKKGFGITLNEIYATGLLQAHFEIQQLAWHYEDGPREIDGISVWPCPEPDKLQALRERLYHFEPDLILLHADAHFFVSYLPELKSWNGPVVGWFTVDYERVNNPRNLLPLFKRCTRMISMADFALNQLRTDFAGPLGKVPLGVNLETFKPVDADQRKALRQKLGWPGPSFVFLIVANNFWRKGIEYAVLAFAQLLSAHPEMARDTLIYLHTERSPALEELIQAHGLSEHIRISRDFDPYRAPLDETDLAEFYQAADAFLLATLGEGFGMPVLEAQACGLPLIVSDNSVLREVAGEAALYIRCPGLIGGQNADGHVWMRCPDPDHCAELMFQLRTSPALQARLGQAGLHQARRMDWSNTALLLAAELASVVETGTLKYLPPEPGLRAV